MRFYLNFHIYPDFFIHHLCLLCLRWKIPFILPDFILSVSKQLDSNPTVQLISLSQSSHHSNHSPRVLYFVFFLSLTFKYKKAKVLVPVKYKSKKQNCNQPFHSHYHLFFRPAIFSKPHS